MIRKVSKDPGTVPGNVYNLDESHIRYARLVKVLVDKYDPRDYRSAGVKPKMVTAIEFISADDKSLLPFAIWPASTHRSNWVTHVASSLITSHKLQPYDFGASVP